MTEQIDRTKTGATEDVRQMTRTWTERYMGGSAATEQKVFEKLARDIMRVQLKNQRAASADGVPHPVDRAVHAKSTLAVDDAELRFLDDLPDDLRVGFAQPGTAYPTTVRFSNAAGSAHADGAPDMRGVALRVTDGDQAHDLLMTNFPVSHARDARQFVEFAKATAGGRRDQVAGLPRLVAAVGLRETWRMLSNVRRARRHRPVSVVTETYWSRGAMTWGDLAVRFLLRPMSQPQRAVVAGVDGPDYLFREVAARLAGGDVRFELCVQRYVNPQVTPIEDTSIEWQLRDSPAEPVAVLTLRQADVTGVQALARARLVDQLAFNPWNTTEDFRPLGNLNRARKAAYDASAAHRLGYRWHADLPRRNQVIGGAAARCYRLLNRRVDWWRLPYRLALLNLEALRNQLRDVNLIDTEHSEAPPVPRRLPPAPTEESRCQRSADGVGNDLSAPLMGAVGATFGRNLWPRFRPDLFNEPNPVTVSRLLLQREQFLPARSLNVLAAAWIQFQVHDWVNHARDPLGQNDVRVPMPPGATWVSSVGGPPESVMRIAGNTSLDPPGASNYQRRFANATTHWWDGSEVYGSDQKRAALLREGAKLRLTAGYLPTDLNGREVTGFNESWWLGLSCFHTLFAREHNLLCDELRAHYRNWTDERVYQTARLIVSALIAKIHTVEWTPAILATKALEVGMQSNWNGPPSTDWRTRLGIWLTDEHASVGIPRTKPDHHGAPFAMTEDFVAVYRMHPLIPDDYLLTDHATGEVLAQQGFNDIRGDRADEQIRKLGLKNSLYSFGIANPGSIALHNYPRSLMDFERNGERIDLSVVDLVRARRRGVPRYNDFRAGLHKPRIKRWEDLTTNPESVARLREVYRSVDEVDTMVGLFAETPPPGFGFSDTAFRIFLLMASRRLQSDRFLTVDFRPEIYSPFGLDWIAQNGMTSVILRHCPELAGVLPREQSAFVPWRPVAPE
jgi:hypothetical protein